MVRNRLSVWSYIVVVDMGWYPESDEEAMIDFLKWLISPILLPVTFATAVYDMMEGTEHLDRGETLRNTAIWGGLAVAVNAYNRLLFPGQFEFRSAAKGFHLLARSSAVRAVASASIPAVTATAMVAPAIGSFYGYQALVESQPVEEQPAMWWHWIAALSGTGPGIGGYSGHVE